MYFFVIPVTTSKTTPLTCCLISCEVEGVVGVHYFFSFTAYKAASGGSCFQCGTAKSILGSMQIISLRQQKSNPQLLLLGAIVLAITGSRSNTRGYNFRLKCRKIIYVKAYDKIDATIACLRMHSRGIQTLPLHACENNFACICCLRNFAHICYIIYPLD